MRIKWLAFVLLVLSLAAHADGIYRCNVNGKTVYAASCPDGKPVRTVKVWRRPTDDDVAQAKVQSAAEKKSLSALEKAQEKQAAKDEKARRKRVKAVAKKHKRCKSLAQKVTWAERDVRSANFKKRDKAQLKLRRANEKYELECGA